MKRDKITLAPSLDLQHGDGVVIHGAGKDGADLYARISAPLWQRITRYVNRLWRRLF